MQKIKYDKKEIYEIVKKDFLDNGTTIKQICELLNIHQGTVKRWILNKEVPPQYFSELNKALNYKYTLDVSNEKMAKINDQFYTPTTEAKRLIDETLKFITTNWKIDLNEYLIIEPSAGDGAFYYNLPINCKKLGMDIDPKSSDIIKKDWFDYIGDGKNIVIGNPPFGLRGQLALKFINHAAKFSDFIAFILPPLFNSNGKGSPMLRINKAFYLAMEIPVLKKEFNMPNGEIVNVHSIFQIWTKLHSSTVEPIFPPKKESEFIKVYAMSNGKTASSRRNVKMIGKVDFYLPSTTFESVKAVYDFKDLPHKRGYGILILKEKEKILKVNDQINWQEASFKSTNGANNLRTQLIINEIEKRMNDN